MLHHFLMAAREAGITQRQYREDPAQIARAFIQAVETYDYDAICVDVDTATLILNAGCAIPPATPPANLRAMLQAARQG